jgi:hypothetical protein
MWISRESCVKLLHDQFVSDFSQIDNVSKLTSNSRWKDKAECFSYYWNSFIEVKNNLEIWQQTEKEWIVKDIKEKPIQEVANGGNNKFMATIQNLSDINFESTDEIWESLLFLWKCILVWFFLLIFFGIFMRMLKIFLRYLYWFCNSHRLIFLKVLLPRWDGKSDREQEKEIAKDMKEKIWRMSQVLWNLHKMNEVSVHEKIMQTFFGKQRLIFI